MLACVPSAAVLGIDAYRVDVEVDVSNGLPMVAIVGLPDAAVNESRERVRAAIKNSGLLVPYDKRVAVNLAPADVRKAGPSFDLPIALGILGATGQVSTEHLADSLIVGELSLDGSVRAIAGALPIAMFAREQKIRRVYVPAGNAREAAVVADIEVYPVSTLLDIVRAMADPALLTAAPYDRTMLAPEHAQYAHDFSEVKGHGAVKRALEVAAAGGHNVILVGPPGSGKTMLARRLPSILPPLSVDEALEATRIYSVSGLLSAEAALVNVRPFRSPHHTASTASLVGGGAVPRPGEVSLAHRGVLFLDELPEFSRDALEVLRQPLEDGVVNVTRVAASYTYPAEFCLVAAMNPCPCGYFGDIFRQCTCNKTQVDKYLRRISGPLLDRIDLHVEVPRLSEEELLQSSRGEPSSEIRERVCRAREIQARRFAKPLPVDPASAEPPHPADGPTPKHQGPTVYSNAHMGPREIRAYCKPSDEVKALLRTAIQQLGLSARAFDRLLKVARTIADLEAGEHILPAHVAEAIQYRSLDRKYWGG